MEYEWDEAKRRSNLAKHGVDFADAQAFAWHSAVETVGARKAYGEVRWRALGMIGTRLHVVVFIKRNGRTRIISLRKANNKEMDEYEASSQAQYPGGRGSHPTGH